jgi:hypothetical protein
MISLLIGTVVLAAPPVNKEEKGEGRIEIWIRSGNKTTWVNKSDLVHFKPDGTDQKTVTIPGVSGLSGSPSRGPVLNSEFDTLVYATETNAQAGGSQLSILTLGKAGDPFVLDGYSVRTILPDPVILGNGSMKVFFGCRPTGANQKGDSYFSFDVKTRAVEPLALPDRHVPYFVLRDGKTAITRLGSGTRSDPSNSYFLVAPGAQPVPIHSDNGGASPLTIKVSRDENVILLYRHGLGTAPPVAQIIDIGSKTVTVAKGLPEGRPPGERIIGMTLSPDGKRFAYMTDEEGHDVTARVYVAAADGTGAKEIYRVIKSSTPRVFVFNWR